jgi:hypothetical protein
MTAAIAGAVALVLGLAAFVADGGLGLERTTYVEIGLMLLGAVLCAAALVAPRARARPLYGAAAVLAFALLAAFTSLSILWSLAPSDSWVEASRTLSYLFAFAGTMALARLVPGQWPAVLHGIALGCVAVCGWALLTKIFPGSLAADETYARLRAPFDYWNASGLMAALGIPPLLWLGARRSGHPAVGALAWPGLALLEVCLMLSYSRGALLAAVFGVGCWFAVVPLRLRGAVVLLGATAGAAPLVGWAFSMTGLTQDKLPLLVRADAGHELGALLALVLVLLLGLGLVTGFLADERPASPAAKRFAGRVLLGVVVLVPVVLVIALASAPGGIDGQVSKTWDQLTNPNAPTPANTPGRFTAASSVRARYWDEAFSVHGVQPWLGTGAGAYATVRTRFRDDALFVRQAHGYVPQTLADLGWVGLALSLLLLGAWAWAAARALGLRLRDRGLPWDAERVGVASLATVALVFGLHSAIDWTWFVPANAIAGLMAAAWVAACPPLRARLVPPDAAAEPGAALPAVAAGGSLWAPLREDPPPLADVAGPGALPVAEADWRRRKPLPWSALAAALLVLAFAGAAAWSALQPVRSVHADDIAIGRLEKGQLEAAVSVAQVAHDRNPLSPEPLWELGYIEEQRGRLANAEAALQRAVEVQPASAEAWRRLGRLQLSTLNQPADAAASFRAAYFLDPHNPQSTSDLLEATRAAGQPSP